LPLGQAEPVAARSARRQRAAERRARRQAGRPADTFGETLARQVRGRGRRAAAAGAAVLAVGLAVGLWLGDAPGLDTRVSPDMRTQVAAVRIGPPPAEPALTLLPMPVLGVAPQGELARPAARPDAAPPAGAAAARPAAAPAAPPAAHADLAERALAAPLRASLAPPPAPDRAAQPAWLANAVPAAVDPQRPTIAIVIDDLGVNRAGTRAAIALPGPLGLAFLAYADDLPEQTASARAAGHEILLHQPMEPSGGADPGPGALFTGVPADENVARLVQGLERIPHLVGVNNHMGSRFTASSEAMAPVLAELGRRGLLYLDSRTTAATVAGRMARELGVPSASRDVFLDHDPAAGRAYVEAQLAKLEAVARETGAALAIGHPHMATVEALRAWLPSLEAKGLQLVPITALIRLREARQLAEAQDERPAPKRDSTSASGTNGRF
jgi:hypothetical protein